MIGDRLPITDYRLPDPGLDLLTVVMHELGHLLGYEHAEAGLMAPVLRASSLHPSSLIPRPSSASSAEAVEPLGQAQWRTGLHSFALQASSFTARPSSPRDDVFADLGDDSSSSDDGSPLLASQDTDVLAAATVRSGEEATQAKVPRRSRLQRYERGLDDWFAQLAAEDVGQ